MKKRNFVALADNPTQNNHQISKLKGVGRTNLLKWEAEFKNNAQDFGKDLRSVNSGRKVKYPKLDKHILDWFKKLKGKKIAVSGNMVMEQA